MQWGTGVPRDDRVLGKYEQGRTELTVNPAHLRWLWLCLRQERAWRRSNATRERASAGRAPGHKNRNKDKVKSRNEGKDRKRKQRQNMAKIETETGTAGPEVVRGAERRGARPDDTNGGEARRFVLLASAAAPWGRYPSLRPDWTGTHAFGDFSRAHRRFGYFLPGPAGLLVLV
jgi:hypothetical protein